MRRPLLERTNAVIDSRLGVDKEDEVGCVFVSGVADITVFAKLVLNIPQILARNSAIGVVQPVDVNEREVELAILNGFLWRIAGVAVVAVTCPSSCTGSNERVYIE